MFKCTAMHAVYFIRDTVKSRLGLVPYKPLICVQYCKMKSSIEVVRLIKVSLIVATACTANDKEEGGTLKQPSVP